MILPDGYSDVPAGKIAAVVTHLEMTERPALMPPPSGPWTLRHVERPDLAWYRDLYRRVGEEWLWSSRIRSSDDRLVARLHHPDVETHALVANGRDEGLLELDFREPATCEIGMFGITAKLVGSGAGRWLMHHALEFLALEQRLHAGTLSQLLLHEAEAGVLLEDGEAAGLELRVIIIIKIINSDYRRAAIKKRCGNVKADKASRAGDENRHAVSISSKNDGVCTPDDLA